MWQIVYYPDGCVAVDELTAVVDVLTSDIMKLWNFTSSKPNMMVALTGGGGARWNKFEILRVKF